MTIAPRTKSFLDVNRIAYALVAHPRAETAQDIAHVAHVPPEWLAKAVLLRDDEGYLLAVVPASRRLDLERVRADLGRALELASERELAAIFSDCDLAAIPAFGAAYGIPTVVDATLLGLEHVYFEAGSGEALGRMGGVAFAALFASAARGEYGSTVTGARTATEPLHDKGARDRRLFEGLAHVFSLRSFGAGLRGQAEYEKNGHAGMLLVKTPELRVVLEAMRADTVLRTHVVHGPTTLFVLEGALDVATDRGRFRVGESEMATLPREERREIHAPVASLFLLAFGRLARPGEVPRSARPRRILIVANRTAGGAHLLAAARARIAAGPCEFLVLAPAVEAHPTWTWEENAARNEARHRLDLACERLRDLGAPVRGTVGDFYPLRAIQDLLLVEPEGFDEIILSTLPEPVSEWLKLDLPARISRRFGVPVSHVVAEE